MEASLCSVKRRRTLRTGNIDYIANRRYTHELEGNPCETVQPSQSIVTILEVGLHVTIYILNISHPFRTPMLPTLSFSSLQSKGDVAVHIEEPLEFLSVLADSSFPDHFSQLIEKSHYYSSPNFQQLFDLLQEHHKEGFRFSLLASQNGNSLRFSSSDQKVKLKVTEPTFFHNSYVGRYLHFSKKVPAKKSPDIETFYTATAALTGEQYEQDLLEFIRREFTDVEMYVLLEKALEYGLQTHTVELETLPLSTGSNTSPLGTQEVNQENALELYEYLCLLHMNRVLEKETEHAKITSIYEVPGFGLNESLGDVYFYCCKNLDPTTFYRLLEGNKWKSIFAQSREHNMVALHNQHGSYLWQADS